MRVPGETPLLEVRGITKRFPGTLALDSVDLRVGYGEVVAVIGENGAGKSTLMNILAGVLLPDEGTIHLDDHVQHFTSVKQAHAAGIALIHQELSLLPNLTVAANLYLGREPTRAGWINKRTLRTQALRYLERVDLKCDPQTLVAELPIGQRQLVEVARALASNARLLIMDEPTSSLAEEEAEVLFDVIRELQERGVSILYVSHRLREVMSIADRVVVLRDGRITGRLAQESVTRDEMVRCMIGRSVNRIYTRKRNEPGPPVLRAERLATRNKEKQRLSFCLREGEIVGLSGLVGSGRTELLRILFGVDMPKSGRVTVADQPVELKSPHHAIAVGIALVPEDRAKQGLILEMATQPNLSLGALYRHYLGWKLLDRTWESGVTKEMVSQLNIQGVQTGKPTRHLSGGNQQKVVLGKWLTLHPRVLLLDEPTRGIDVGAKQETYKAIDELAARGMAILLVSSESDEIIALSDRVLVMQDHAIVGELDHTELNERALMQLATGTAHEPLIEQENIGEAA
ncbi:MAG: sugar ABC transporter ATP-binding protein [Rhodothermaceae bacterium]|nr:sugar ABC transporter ATP-binding protein [Rhodothermaceae bacterium]MXX59715.1 sugar ABC transporter ATP-binding protein [Rhodothermaceae bacterium]MYD20223.1 sugar ABC transporter ATP-binding protein [Rhodothermaceae bacterium]MYD57224.1 sugar ABC transporter ATP-binding protein [Rhodothermaceae bacterium]MYI42788.1 sugar ABC transporter ATP-binding protein [Rhodothermaceae bacterium]